MNEAFVKQMNGFHDFLECRHYSVATLGKYKKCVHQFLEWCENTPGEINGKSEEVSLTYLTLQRQTGSGYKTVRAAIHSYFFYLTGTKLSLPRAWKYSPIAWVETEINGFYTYLDDVAALEEATIFPHCRYVSRFLEYAANKGICKVSEIMATHVRGFLAVELAHYKPSSRKTITTKIRSYFRYLQFRGEIIDESVLKLPMSSPVWTMSSIPKTLSTRGMEALLSCYDMSTSEGVRDYAIATCLSELGLRCAEVASLTLDDLKWHSGTVLIRKTKSHTDRLLPIPAKAGEAISAYLLHSRQHSDIRNLFLSISRRNGKAMNTGEIRKAIIRAYERAGIKPAKSPHMLRHYGECFKMVNDDRNPAKLLTHPSIRSPFYHCLLRELR